MYFSNAFFVLPLLIASTIANPTPDLEKRLTRSKCNQYTSSVCDGSNGDNGNGRIQENVNIAEGSCIDMDGRTMSIYLARGTGLVWRRSMAAYEKTGCPDDARIESVTDRDPAGPCVPINSIMLGVPGSDLSQGRIMSVKFSKI